MFWTTVAHAMSPAGAGPGEGPSQLVSMGSIVLMFAVFYFLLIRPQQKRAKEQKNMLSALKRGDEVITAGGIFGRITEITDEYAILDLGDSKIKVLRASISSLSSVLAKAPPQKAGKKDGKNTKEDAPKGE